MDPALLPHDSHRNGIIVCASVPLAIAAVFVGLRFYTRTKIVKVLGPCDWCILLALVCYLPVIQETWRVVVNCHYPQFSSAITSAFEIQRMSPMAPCLRSYRVLVLILLKRLP